MAHFQLPTRGKQIGLLHIFPGTYAISNMYTASETSYFETYFLIVNALTHYLTMSSDSPQHSDRHCHDGQLGVIWTIILFVCHIKFVMLLLPSSTLLHKTSVEPVDRLHC
ncbi:hypothetical protein V8B97DRAFT_1546841 [Scleroderma yunnanense]